MEDWRGLWFFLLYTQYGGSGIQLTYSDIAEMEIGEIIWFKDKLEEARKHEASEIEKIKR